MDSSITQVVSERIDQTGPILFLIGQGKHSRAQQAVDIFHATFSVPAMARICSHIHCLIRQATFTFLIQLHQISVNRLRLLPLFEYHYSHLVPHPRAKLISQPNLHAAVFFASLTGPPGVRHNSFAAQPPDLLLRFYVYLSGFGFFCSLTHRLASYPVSVRRLLGFATPLPPLLPLPAAACGLLHLAVNTRDGTFTR